MIAPPIPANETERLADLRALRILDTPPEQRFDRIVSLAAAVFDVPIAYIALVDSDRQWLKAKCGLETEETGRDVSFCGHTILEAKPLVIPDASEDPRFHDNPLVVSDPHVRFYAGHPLAGPSGQLVGTLCLVDREPRDANQISLQTLEHLARLAEHELNMFDLISTQHELLDTKTQLIKTQERLQDELREASRYVQSQLPPPLIDDRISIDWCFEASSQVGGDIFGYHWLDDRHLAIYLVDIMGHGVGAALFASTVQATLNRHTLPDTEFGQPLSVMASLNRAFPMSAHDGRFFTAWYGVYDHQARSMHYVNAGHPPPFLLAPNARPYRLESTAMPVGIIEEAQNGDAVIEVAPGSRLMLYTDGAIEAADSAGRQLDISGLEAIVANLFKAGGAPIIEQVRQAIQDFQGRVEFGDDLSLLELAFS